MVTEVKCAMNAVYGIAVGCTSLVMAVELSEVICSAATKLSSTLVASVHTVFKTCLAMVACVSSGVYRKKKAEKLAEDRQAQCCHFCKLCTLDD